MNRNSSRLEVPQELTNLLLDFTVSVLINKPGDVVDYAASYFNRLKDERKAPIRCQTTSSSSSTTAATITNQTDKHLDEENENEDSFDFS
uniref:RIIa domain-containing protein n=1 Tax=Tetranychus urticae TaxID=32264 RepID=T1L305_TETUR